jgi:hypothetical protein
MLKIYRKNKSSICEIVKEKKFGITVANPTAKVKTTMYKGLVKMEKELNVYIYI